MKHTNKNAPNIKNSEHHKTSTSILSDKQYTVNELQAIFSYNALMLIESKEELLKYWYMAVETGKKKFINTVDSVICKRYPRYE
jgi:hypothetical protein